MNAIQLDLFTPAENQEFDFLTKSIAVISDRQDRQRKAVFGTLGRIGKKQHSIDEELYNVRAELNALKKQMRMLVEN